MVVHLDLLVVEAVAGDDDAQPNALRRTGQPVHNDDVFTQIEECFLCGAQPSTPTGEHVWPQWLLKEFPVSDGPYVTEKNGHAVLNREGVPRRNAVFPRVFLPCCTSCNGELDRRFEKRAKPVMRRILGTSDVQLAPEETQVAAEWFVKTALFLSHHKVRHTDPGIRPHVWSPAPPTDIYRWTVTGEPPPLSLSLWIGWRPDSPHLRKVAMQLPRVHADGRDHVFQVAQHGLRFLSITLLYHPGWPVEHPHERTGEVIRLWPPRESGQPISLHHREPTSDVRWVRGLELHFSPGYYGRGTLPNLDEVGLGLIEGVDFARAVQLH